ncbi:MAG: hypothetical protein WCC90_06060 [Methylocella sp.]
MTFRGSLRDTWIEGETIEALRDTDILVAEIGDQVPIVIDLAGQVERSQPLCGINAVAVVNIQLLRRFLQERPAVSRAQESISGFTLGMV